MVYVWDIASFFLYDNMHARGIGLVLSFFLLNLLDLSDFAQGKAFPEDDEEYKYRYNQKLKTQFHPLYKQNLPPKFYYTPHIDGQPIFLPPVDGSARHVKKILDDHYEKNREYGQRWTFKTPSTYDYDRNNQRDYYEDSGTSNSMIKNLLDDAYENGIHRGDYHLLSITPESYISYGSKQTKDFKNKSGKQNLRKNKKKVNKNSHEFTESPISMKYKFEAVTPDYAPEVVKVIGKKSPSDQATKNAAHIKHYDYGSEQMGEKEHPDDYASEHASEEEFSQHTEETLDTKLHHYAPDEIDDKEITDYSPEVVEIIGQNVLHIPDKEVVVTKFTENYPPEMVQETSSKVSDYSPEVVKVIGSKFDDDYSAEIVTVVGTKNSNKMKHAITSKNENLPYKTKNIKEKEAADSSKSPLSEQWKTASIHGSNRDLLEDESLQKSEDFNSHDLAKEHFNLDERFEEFDVESPGSGDIVDSEDIRSNSLLDNTDFPRSLSALNSNIWSLIFNPNAEFKKVKKCVTRSNESGFCMYVQHCDVPNVVTSLEQLLQDACVIDDIFIGICCPEFPVQTVKVHWEHMTSDNDKRTDDFDHKSEDCGIRSDAASKAQSWPWKAQLVSMSNGRIFCDGVLIRDNYVLTAAHCTRKIPKNQILVRLGQHDESSGDDYAVVEIKRHAQYNRRSMLNDVALLKLGRRIGHDEHINTICIPDDDDKDDDNNDKDDKNKVDNDKDNKNKVDHAGKKAILLGSRGSLSKKSKKDERLRVMTNKECGKVLGIKVPATILCTEARNVKERTCNADSGAPLIIEDGNKYEVIGILSWNRNDCDPRFPSIFSRVSKYARWIKKHTV